MLLNLSTLNNLPNFKIMSMKKISIGVLALIFGFSVITFSSCKSHVNCPAYGKKTEALKAKSI